MPDALQLETPRADSTQTQRANGGAETSIYSENTPAVTGALSAIDYAVQSWRANQRIGPSNTGASFSAGAAQPLTETTATSQPEMRSLRILGMHKWIGSIVAVEDGILTAELFPFDHDGPSLVADFDLDLLSPDESLAAPGSVIYLTTRIIEADWGQKTATTQLRLRRPWRWSKQDLDEVLAQARRRAYRLQGHARRRT
jgi:hypothetical protein